MGRLSRAGDAGEVVALKRAVCLETSLQGASQRACFLTAARWLLPGSRLALSPVDWRADGPTAFF
jgi:hypothetical protein